MCAAATGRSSKTLQIIFNDIILVTIGKETFVQIYKAAKPCRKMGPDRHLTGYFIVSSVESAPEIWLNFNKWYFNYKYYVMCSGDKCADVRRLHLTPGNIWTSMWLLWNRADGSFVLAFDNIRVGILLWNRINLSAHHLKKATIFASLVWTREMFSLN